MLYSIRNNQELKFSIDWPSSENQIIETDFSESSRVSDVHHSYAFLFSFDDRLKQKILTSYIYLRHKYSEFLVKQYEKEGKSWIKFVCLLFFFFFANDMDICICRILILTKMCMIWTFFAFFFLFKLNFVLVEWIFFISGNTQPENSFIFLVGIRKLN